MAAIVTETRTLTASSIPSTKVITSIVTPTSTVSGETSRSNIASTSSESSTLVSNSLSTDLRSTSTSIDPFTSQQSTSRNVPTASPPVSLPVSHANVGLTAGAKAGIAIGAIVAAILIAAAAFFFGRKFQNRIQIPNTPGEPPPYGVRPELDGYPVAVGKGNKMGIVNEERVEQLQELPDSATKVETSSTAMKPGVEDAARQSVGNRGVNASSYEYPELV